MICYDRYLGTLLKKCDNQSNIIKQCLGSNTASAVKVDDKKITPPARMMMERFYESGYCTF